MREELIDKAVSQWHVAVARMNGIARDTHDLKSLPAIVAYQRAMKDALRAIRALIAEAPDPSHRAQLREILREHKRSHYHICLIKAYVMRGATNGN